MTAQNRNNALDSLFGPNEVIVDVEVESEKILYQVKAATCCHDLPIASQEAIDEPVQSSGPDLLEQGRAFNHPCLANTRLVRE